MATYQELLKQRENLEAEIEKARRAEVAAVRAQILDLMSTYGLAVADIGLKSTRRAGKTGVKVAPKYRNPQTGDTWSGRGLKPTWLKTKLDAGAKLEDFAVG